MKTAATWAAAGPDSPLLKAISAEVAPVVDGQGFQLVELTHLKSRGAAFVRVLVYRPEGVSAEDCGRLGRAILFALLVVPGLGEISLEVSSPGTDREFRFRHEFDLFLGRDIAVLLEEATEWQTGVLMGAEGGGVRLNVDGRELKIKLSHIRRARLHTLK